MYFHGSVVLIQWPHFHGIRMYDADGKRDTPSECFVHVFCSLINIIKLFHGSLVGDSESVNDWYSLLTELAFPAVFPLIPLVL